MTQRRLRAGKMFDDGSSQADVVRELGVSRETASQWHATWREHGVQGLLGAQRAGRVPRLTDEQLVKVERALAKGPTRNGFPTELWTLSRVATVIEKVTGVSYSTTQTWSILRTRLGWSRQRPARRAIEADQDAIAAWARDRWPVVKKRQAAPGVDRLRRRVGLLTPPFGDEPPGHRAARPRCSLTTSTGSDSRWRVHWPSRPTILTPPWCSVCERARSTTRHSLNSSRNCASCSASTMPILGDGLPSHRSRTMTALLKAQRHWLVTERLPPYGHDLNPNTVYLS